MIRSVDINVYYTLPILTGTDKSIIFSLNLNELGFGDKMTRALILIYAFKSYLVILILNILYNYLTNGIQKGCKNIKQISHYFS